MITDSHKTTYLEIQGQKTPIWIYGDIKKPLVFFIHGFFRGFSEYVGDLPMRHMKDKYCLIAFDLPGFGKMKDSNINRIEYLRDVIRSIAKERDYYIFGLSYGGLLALKYAINKPTGLRGLIIAGTPYFKLIDIVKLPFLVLYMRNTQLIPLAREFEFLRKSNLRKIKTPTLLLYSSRDKRSRLEMGKRLEKDIPSSELFSIDKHDHSWLLHNIKESGFLKAIDSFIDSKGK